MRAVRVQKNFQFLKTLNSTKKEIPRVIRAANNDELLTLVEIAYNLIKFCYVPSAKQLARLKPFAPALRSLARTRSRKSAEQILAQQPHQFYSRLLQPLLLE